MTAIAGIVQDGKVWIGGDSAGVGGMSIETRTDPKVFCNGEHVFGYTDSFRLGQILEFEFSPPAAIEGEHGMAYMVRQFVPAVKEAFRYGGYNSNHDGEDRGGTFLVGYRGQLYQVAADYQVGRVRQPYHACGCGSDLVLGSLHATDQFELSPRERIVMALSAAAEFSAGVRGPFTVLSI
jgi:hypothetical protein